MNENVRLLEDLRDALMECDKCSFCLMMGRIVHEVDEALKEAYHEE